MLIETVACAILSANCARRSSGESVLSHIADKSGQYYVSVASEPTVTYVFGVESALALYFSVVPEVTSVLTERTADNLLVWITADGPSRDARERIFQKQFDMIDTFPEVNFDFNLVSTRSGDPSEVASSAKVIFAKGE